MALSNDKKTELIKKIIIKRIQGINKFSVLITTLKNLNWTKIKNFLDQDLQEYADLLGFNSQESLDEKDDILALKEEKDTF